MILFFSPVLYSIFWFLYIVVCNINNLNNNKALGPNSIPTDIFHLIKLNVAKPLADIVNLSFQTGIYIDVLKISKVAPIFKEKGSDLDYSNYRPISLLSNINKIIEKIMHERLYRNNINAFMSCSSDSEQSTQHLMPWLILLRMLETLLIITTFLSVCS